jgi:hypothetical protein
MTEKKKTLAPLCKRAYICRTEETYCRPALALDGNNFYFIDQGNKDCLYRKDYGRLHTCDCPVRMEIFRRYKI